MTQAFGFANRISLNQHSKRPATMPKRSIRNELLAQVRLSDKELGSRYELAVNPVYWRELCPHVPLDSAQALHDASSVNHQLVDSCVNQLRTRGYFKTSPLIPESTLSSMRECVEAVRNAGWPPVFAFLYDPFWAVTRIPFVAEFLLADLGDEFNIIMSRVWCYYVPPSRGAGGWTPHADAYSNPANRLTVWIPLTDATLDNGCMYVVPKDFAYGGAPPKRERLRADTVRSDYALDLLHSCKALPAAAGHGTGLAPHVGERPSQRLRSRDAEQIGGRLVPGQDLLVLVDQDHQKTGHAGDSRYVKRAPAALRDHDPGPACASVTVPAAGRSAEARSRPNEAMSPTILKDANKASAEACSGDDGPVQQSSI